MRRRRTTRRGGSSDQRSPQCRRAMRRRHACALSATHSFRERAERPSALKGANPYDAILATLSRTPEQFIHRREGRSSLRRRQGRANGAVVRQKALG